MNQTLINTMAGALGAIVTYAYGGWSELLGFFLIVICIDYVTGIIASLKEGKGLSSSVGWLGLGKKALMLVIIMLAHRMDLLFDSQFVMNGAIYFYLANELISVTENYGRIGLPLPDQVKKIIAVLKEKGNE